MSLGRFSRAFEEACTLPMLEAVFVLTKLLPDSVRGIVSEFLRWTTKEFALIVFAPPDDYNQPEWDILAESGELWAYINTQRIEIGFAELDTPVTIAKRMFPDWYWMPENAAQQQVREKLSSVIDHRIALFISANCSRSQK